MIYFRNDSDPYFPYYYHDRKNQQEYLFLYNHDLEKESCFVEDFDYPYPVGTLLCKCLNIITEIGKPEKGYNNDVADSLQRIPKIIYDFLPEGKERNTSLDDLRMFMEYALYQNVASSFDFYGTEFSRILNCYHYVELCSQDKKYSTLDCLVKFSILNGLRIQSSFKALNGFPKIEFEAVMRPWEIKSYLDGRYSLDNLSENLNDNSPQQTYYELFYLDSLSDLILTSLSELFAIGKTVNRCELCGSFFIPRRSDTKYCDGPFPGAPNRTCRQEAKLQKQNQRIRLSETERQYRSISQMMRQRVSDFYADEDDINGNLATDELVNFQKKHKELRAKYKNFEIPEWQYSNWLKSFYKRKYK